MVSTGVCVGFSWHSKEKNSNAFMSNKSYHVRILICPLVMVMTESSEGLYEAGPSGSELLSTLRGNKELGKDKAPHTFGLTPLSHRYNHPWKNLY